MKRSAELQNGDGAGPFVTFCHLYLPDGHALWLARNHRKGLGVALSPRAVWQTPGFNVLMASGFAVGSVLFIAGSILALAPALATAWSLPSQATGWIYFAGSVFFSCAAYLQLFQSANAGEHPISSTPPRLRSPVGWRPQDPGWLSSATQFPGTLLFNVNTFFGLTNGNWLWQDLTIWAPDMAGSVLFLVAGYLAVIETCHTWWTWQPGNLAWWIVVVNMAGCVAFMISAILAYVPPQGVPQAITNASIWFTLIGALCFLAGALLSIRESYAAQQPPAP